MEKEAAGDGSERRSGEFHVANLTHSRVKDFVKDNNCVAFARDLLEGFTSCTTFKAQQFNGGASHLHSGLIEALGGHPDPAGFILATVLNIGRFCSGIHAGWDGDFELALCRFLVDALNAFIKLQAPPSADVFGKKLWQKEKRDVGSKFSPTEADLIGLDLGIPGCVPTGAGGNKLLGGDSPTLVDLLDTVEEEYALSTDVLQPVQAHFDISNLIDLSDECELADASYISSLSTSSTGDQVDLSIKRSMSADFGGLGIQLMSRNDSGNDEGGFRDAQITEWGGISWADLEYTKRKLEAMEVNEEEHIPWISDPIDEPPNKPSSLVYDLDRDPDTRSSTTTSWSDIQTNMSSPVTVIGAQHRQWIMSEIINSEATLALICTLDVFDMQRYLFDIADGTGDQFYGMILAKRLISLGRIVECADFISTYKLEQVLAPLDILARLLDTKDLIKIQEYVGEDQNRCHALLQRMNRFIAIQFIQWGVFEVEYGHRRPTTDYEEYQIARNELPLFQQTLAELAPILSDRFQLDPEIKQQYQSLFVFSDFCLCVTLFELDRVPTPTSASAFHLGFAHKFDSLILAKAKASDLLGKLIVKYLASIGDAKAVYFAARLNLLSYMATGLPPTFHPTSTTPNVGSRITSPPREPATSTGKDHPSTQSQGVFNDVPIVRPAIPPTVVDSTSRRSTLPLFDPNAEPTVTYHLPSPVRVAFVDREDQLNDVREIVFKSYAVGLDTEWMPDASIDGKNLGRHNRTAILQIACEPIVYLLDIVALKIRAREQLESLLLDLFEAPVTKLAFDWQLDQDLLEHSLPGLRARGFQMTNFTDLKPEWMMLLGNHGLLNNNVRRPAGSLAAMVRCMLGANLDKTAQLTNWEARPLSGVQMTYAACDVYCLLALHSHMEGHPNALPKTF